MVIKKIIDGISIKLNEIFGDDYEIYDNKVEQGMKKPCFFIYFLDGDINRQIGLGVKSYLDVLHFDIVGFSKNDSRIELNDMSDKLRYGLEYITLADKTLIRANNLKSKIEDDVLHFFIDYKIFTSQKDSEKEDIKMNKIQLMRR